MRAVAQGERPPELPSDPLGQPDGLALALDILGDDHELIPTEAGHGVALTHHRPQPRRQRGEQFVAGRVTEVVVDELEVVQVEQQDRQHPPDSPLAVDRVSEQAHQQSPIR